MTISTSTLELSTVAVVAAFGAAVADAAGDAAAISRAVTGIADGNDYGRYFAAENPLVPYAAAAVSVDAMIARGVELRAAVARVIATAEADAAGSLGALWLDLMGITGALRRSCANPADAIRILAGLAAWAYTAPPHIASDPIGDQVDTLVAATARLVRRAAAISLTVASADYVPASYQDAIAVRNRVAGVLDAVADEAGDSFDDNAYRTLRTLKSAIVADLTARGGSLAPLVTRTFGGNQPALVVAYRQYQDATRAGEVLARNDCPHPAFLPVTLELLAD